MYKTTLVGDDAPPHGRTERIGGVRDALSAVGIFPRRYSQAQAQGIVITYAHVDPHATGDAARAVAAALHWSATEVSEVPGVVAVTTTWAD